MCSEVKWVHISACFSGKKWCLGLYPKDMRAFVAVSTERCKNVMVSWFIGHRYIWHPWKYACPVQWRFGVFCFFCRIILHMLYERSVFMNTGLTGLLAYRMCLKMYVVFKKKKLEGVDEQLKYRIHWNMTLFPLQKLQQLLSTAANHLKCSIEIRVM